MQFYNLIVSFSNVYYLNEDIFISITRTYFNLPQDLFFITKALLLTQDTSAPKSELFLLLYKQISSSMAILEQDTNPSMIVSRASMLYHVFQHGLDKHRYFFSIFNIRKLLIISSDVLSDIEH